MKDDLTRAIAEALGCVAYHQPRWADGTEGKSWCLTHRKPPVQNVWPCPETERIAAALAPLIEARVREARAESLKAAADAWTQGAWASTPRHKDRVADRMAASQYAGDWLRERAEEVRRNA